MNDGCYFPEVGTRGTLSYRYRMTLKLFEAFGIELEYMIVDRRTLDVRPVADELLAELAGQPEVSDYTSGPVTWSNELALHVIELKTTQPATDLAALPGQFQKAIDDLQPTLDRMGLSLLPTAMHPWMDPATQTRLWPHENRQIYEAYDHIFDCKSHGWANVQSVHLNLPFDGDEEFAPLHAAARLVLPILPALAASSPIVDGRLTGMLNSRLQYYADHCRAVPSLIGNVIPEPVYDEASYRREIYAPIADDMGPLDRDRVFELDFLNSRGAIARFDRGSIELRLMDVQEHPGADVAICAAVIAVMRGLVEQRWSTTAQQRAVSTQSLRSILDRTIIDAESCNIDSPEYLTLFGVEPSDMTAGELWRRLLNTASATLQTPSPNDACVELILSRGTLATRVQRSLDNRPDHARTVQLYRHLADCLRTGRSFRGTEASQMA